MSDAELVLRAQSGDKDAFTALYDAYFERIYDFAYQMVRNRDDAADVVSEAFLKAMERLRSLKDPDAFKGWLYAIARNASLNLIEKRGRTTAMSDDFEPAPVVASDPSDLVSARELTRLVWDAAATLNPRDYSIFDMTVRQGLDSAEVAQALGVKASHAYVLVSRLKSTVEEALSAVVLARAGRRDCADLDRIVGSLEGELSPRLRRSVTQHLRSCADCRRSRARYASAAALLGGVASAAPMSGLKEEIARKLDDQWPTRGPGARRTHRARNLVITGTALVLVLLAIAQWTGPDPDARSLLVQPTRSPAAEPVVTETPAAETPQPTTKTAAARAATPRPPVQTPAPAGPPAVSSVSIFPAILADGACGPRQATVTAVVSAPRGVRSVRMTAQLGGLTSSQAMSGSGSTYRATIGPYDQPGTVSVRVTVQDAQGATAQSTPRAALVRSCATPPLPTPTPKAPTPTPRPPQEPLR